MSFELDPNFEAALTADVSPRLARAAPRGAAALDGNLAAGERTGLHHAGLPRRSSRGSIPAEEFSQEQFGGMRSGVYAEQTDDLEWHVGLKGNMAILMSHEFGSIWMLPRANIARTLENEDVQRDMLEAMR